MVGWKGPSPYPLPDPCPVHDPGVERYQRGREEKLEVGLVDTPDQREEEDDKVVDECRGSGNWPSDRSGDWFGSQTNDRSKFGMEHLESSASQKKIYSDKGKEEFKKDVGAPDHMGLGQEINWSVTGCQTGHCLTPHRLTPCWIQKIGAEKEPSTIWR